MSAKHHPDEATITAYAAGTLEEAHAVLISCHLEICGQCREALRTAEDMGGALLQEEDDAAIVSDGAFGRLLEKIAAENEASADKDREEAGPAWEGDWQRMPRALRHYLEGDLQSIKWKRAGPGIWQLPLKLPQGAQSSLRLLRIAPGRSVPEHGHGGQELTLILSGAYKDELGHFGAGDVADLDEDIEHQPVVVSDEDCICLAATEAPTRFKSFFGRLFQPFVRI